MFSAQLFRVFMLLQLLTKNNYEEKRRRWKTREISRQQKAGRMGAGEGIKTSLNKNTEHESNHDTYWHDIYFVCLPSAVEKMLCASIHISKMVGTHSNVTKSDKKEEIHNF